MPTRNIDEKLDEVVFSFKNHIEAKIGKEISYKLASKLYSEVIQRHIYIKNVEYIKSRRKKDRKIIFNIEMKNE